MSLPKRSFLVFAALTMSGATHPPLTGEWGGDRARLILSAAGGQIERDCGSGTIKGPLHLDYRHHFKARGTFEAYSPGPSPADMVPGTRPAVYQGVINGDEMTLVIETEGAAEPTTLHLVKGKRVKIIRCL